MEADLLVRSKWMVSREFGTEDIPKEPMVTIATVIKPDAEEEKTRTKNRGVLTFKEPFAKPLEMIATHLTALKLMFGNETNNWVGKRIKVAAIVGTYFKKRQTAVRILGSPDIAEAMSFSVRSFGGGSDTYNLVPIGAGAASNRKPAAKAVDQTVYAAGIVWWGKSKGKEIATLLTEELEAQLAQYSTWLTTAVAGPVTTTTRTNYDELLAEKAHRAELEQQMDAGQPPAGAPPQTSADDGAPT